MMMSRRMLDDGRLGAWPVRILVIDPNSGSSNEGTKADRQQGENRTHVGIENGKDLGTPPKDLGSTHDDDTAFS